MLGFNSSLQKLMYSLHIVSINSNCKSLWMELIIHAQSHACFIISYAIWFTLSSGAGYVSSGCYVGSYYLTTGSHVMRGCRTCTCKQDNNLTCTVDKKCVIRHAWVFVTHRQTDNTRCSRLVTKWLLHLHVYLELFLFLYRILLIASA